MRIVSLLPSATEVVAALGLAEQLVGVSHACDFPPEAVRGRPVLTRSAIPAGLSQSEIDRTVAERLGCGESLYLLDEALLAALAPDVILTQELCDVCAVSADTVRSAACRLASDPRVVSLEPTTIAGVLDAIRMVGAAAGAAERGAALVNALQARLEQVARTVADATRRPRVAALEWLDPPFSAGHWVPEMIAYAGGVDAVGRAGEPSVRIGWEQVIGAAPEVLLLVPCGYTAAQAASEAEGMPLPDGWWELPAAQTGDVFALNATAFFSRPGPRVVDGVELLTALLHPALMLSPAPEDASRVALSREVAQ